MYLFKHKTDFTFLRWFRYSLVFAHLFKFKLIQLSFVGLLVQNATSLCPGTRPPPLSQCHCREHYRSTTLPGLWIRNLRTMTNMIGTAVWLGIVLVVCLASTSGMSILQTAITSYLQKNCYKRAVHFNVRCLFFFSTFPPPRLHVIAFTAPCAEQTGRALSAPINKVVRPVSSITGLELCL